MKPRPSRAVRRNQGQTMVLSAMTMLVMSMMVLITLEIGHATKLRMEAQTLSDAAAFNQAVATARAYNQVAIFNRAAAAAWVSLAATQSLISWSGVAMNYVVEANNLAYNIAGKDTSKTACKRKAFDDVNTNFQNDLKAKWETLDALAGARAIKEQGAAVTFGGAGKDALSQLSGNFNSNAVAKQVVSFAHVSGLSAGTGNDAPTPGGDPAEVSLFVTMGSRGDSFTNNRPPVPIPVLTPTGVNFTLEPGTGPGGGGGSGFGSPGPLMTTEGSSGAVKSNAKHLAETYDGVNGAVSWADDDATGTTFTENYVCSDDGKKVLLDIANYSGTVPATAFVIGGWVASDDQHHDDDQHYWQADNDYGAKHKPEKQHTLYCTDTPENHPCHGIWGGFTSYAYGDVADKGKAFGQPVLSTVMSLNRAANEPWDLHYDFKGWNHTSKYATAGNASLGNQGVMSSSVAYYYRAGHPKEPPNFYNPFWRATLVSGRLNQATNPVKLMSSNGLSDQATSAKKLLGLGYVGY